MSVVATSTKKVSLSYCTMQKTETQKLVSLLKRSYDRGAWHGPSVKETLELVSPEISSNRLPNTHSIIELVSHMITWRKFVIAKLEGGDLKVTDEMNFPKQNDWSKVIEELEGTQAKLLSLVETFPVEKLGELVPHPNAKYTYYTMINGIIHHDLYHTGQIILITKATAKQSI
jgi:uncharacterized damage-inducible protein DinB